MQRSRLDKDERNVADGRARGLVPQRADAWSGDSTFPPVLLGSFETRRTSGSAELGTRRRGALTR